MGRFVRFLLVGCILAMPALAQRGGGGFHGGTGGFHGGMGGFHGGGFVGPGFRGGSVRGGFGGFRGYYPSRGYYPRNRFVFGLGFPYWPYYGAGWGYGHPYYPYYAYSDPYYDFGYAYGGPNQVYCSQANGQLLYQIKLTYQDSIWLAQNYWYTAGTLNFTTLQGQQNKTPIDTIDRALTFQLNNACGLNFQFPR